MKSTLLLKFGIAAVAIAGAAGGAYFLMTPSAPSAPQIKAAHGGFYGVIVDGETDKPLSGAIVRIHNTEDAQAADRLCESDESGRFGFELDNGSYIITSEHAGYRSRGQNDIGRELTIEDGTSYVNAKLRLWPSASLQGRITAGNTGIQANIVINYDRDASGAENYEFLTLKADENGSFVVSDAAAGIVTVSVSSEGFANIDLRDIVIKAGQTVDLGDIPLRDGVSLFGQVTDAKARRAIRGAQISIKNTSNELIAKAVTDSQGNYRLPALDLMQITFDISAEGYHPITQKMMLKGNSNREFDVMLYRAWGLSLNIQNQTERDPIQTIVKITDIVSGNIVYNETLANGTYSLDSLKGGPFLIEAESGDHITKTATRASTGDNIYIRLKPYGKIIVKALNSDGTELSDGEYRYYYRASQTDTATDNTWSAIASSEFTIGDLPEGYYRVEIRKTGMKEFSSHEFKLLNGDVRNLTMQLTEGGVLTGHVITAQGNTIHATVTLVNDSRTTQTDRDGYFTFDKMPAEPATIIIKPNREDAETKFENIVVKENGKLERDFQVDSARTDQRAERRAKIQEMRDRGELPKPPWGDGKPPWGDGKPPWGDGKPPWGDGKPPWGDGQPLWGNGQPPWGDGPPPWGDGQPPWGDGPPPWGDGQPPWGNGQPPGDDGKNPRPTEGPALLPL